MSRLSFLLSLILALPSVAQNADGLYNAQRVDLPLSVAGNFPPYYLVVPVDQARGVLIVFAGMNGDAYAGLRETNLPYVAASRGLATVLIPTRGVLTMDETTLAFTNAIVRDALSRFHLPADLAVIGGFSAGGLLALGYVVESKRDPRSTTIKPRAVFAIDSPIDLRHAYGQFEREVEKGCSDVGSAEGRYVVDLMQRTLGTPDDAPENYARYSPLLMGERQGGNARYLTHLPVRMYHEPAILWQIENRCRGLLDSNLLGGSELVNTLRMAGNDGAELLLPEGRGYRASGERHPHTWALVEAGDLVTWAMDALGVEPDR